ncbi:MAG: DNA-directed RNA polymerase subunit alpha C-terminal domain-containing protein [Archangium sp.]|nr:DNA-directed RNA polymerase subunit alpha C-terminal domain-containing protein [Archangium sp.]MDP3575564.1 DNA-directed RNA polymerase subunit alpha C-terminal domain-containing protein [Archangium sp.]
MVLRKLEELELSVAVANQRSKAGLETVQHLCERTEAELLKMKGFGRTHLKEVKEVLASLGLSLGMRF